jgi:outer membrane protein assembly factor BamE (lipoprotein component of BamABCDE complex)
MKRMTQERMTNDELMPKLGCRSRAERRSSGFVVRYWSFVILLVTFSFALASCNPSKRLTKANVDEVAEGMAKKQVESILGLPTTVDTKDFALLKKTVYVYNQGKDTITIVFKDDKVQSKVSTLSE